MKKSLILILFTSILFIVFFIFGFRKNNDGIINWKK